MIFLYWSYNNNLCTSELEKFYIWTQLYVDNSAIRNLDNQVGKPKSLLQYLISFNSWL